MEGIHKRTQSTLKVGAKAETTDFATDKRWMVDWENKNK
jgi:hypothetical protein